jgi:putative transposase
MLSKNYKLILLPKFNTSQMLDSSFEQPGKSLSSATKRKMQGLAHFRFQQKLAYLTEKYGSKMILVSEAYTTKTCGLCGNIKENVGSSKIYKCDNCSYCMDRDIHGARNIWIRNLQEMINC